MQAIIETLFDAIYLFSVVTLGIIMISKCKGRKQYRLFGIMRWYLGQEMLSTSCLEQWHFAPQVYRIIR